MMKISPSKKGGYEAHMTFDKEHARKVEHANEKFVKELKDAKD